MSNQLVGCLLAVLSAAALAQSEAASDFEFSPRASLRTDAWTGSRALDDERGLAAVALWTDGKLRTSGGTVVWNGWLRDQTKAADEPYADSRRGRVRELYWRHSFGAVGVRAGRLMPAWGRADGLNPTDNLSARDFTLLAPEDADLRFGHEGAQFDLALPRQMGTLNATWFANASSHRIPLVRSPGVSYAVQPPPHRSQWALQWDISRDGIDGSLSYFNGHDLLPDLELATITATGVQIALRNARTQVWGADLSVQRGAVVWRAEAAYARPHERNADSFAHKRASLWLVGGPEWNSGDWTVGTQVVWQWVRDFQKPDIVPNPIVRAVAWRQAATANQIAAQQAGFTLRVARRVWNDTLLLETSLLQQWAVRDGDSHQAAGLWRAKLAYAVNDHCNVQLGHELPFGPERSQLGQLKDNRLAYVQVRFSFY